MPLFFPFEMALHHSAALAASHCSVALVSVMGLTAILDWKGPCEMVVAAGLAHMCGFARLVAGRAVPTGRRDISRVTSVTCWAIRSMGWKLSISAVVNFIIGKFFQTG